MWHHTCAKYRKMSLVNYSVEVSAHWQVSHCLIISFPNWGRLAFISLIKLHWRLRQSCQITFSDEAIMKQRCILLNLFVLIYKTNQQPSCLHSKQTCWTCFMCLCVSVRSRLHLSRTHWVKSRFASYTFAISDALIVFQLHITLNF